MARPGATEQRLQLGEELLACRALAARGSFEDRIETGTVGRRVGELGALGLDGFADAGDLVGGEVVHDDEVAPGPSSGARACSIHRRAASPPIQSRSGGGRLLWGRRWIGNTIVAHTNLERAMTEPSPPTRNPVTLDHDGTLLVVIELSLKSWLAAAVVPLRRLADGASFGDGFSVFLSVPIVSSPEVPSENAPV